MCGWKCMALGMAAASAAGFSGGGVPPDATALVAVPAAQEQFHWRGRLAAGRTVEIKGVNGDVRATAAGSEDIEVTALKRGRRSDPEEVEIQVIEHDEGVTICAVYPTPRGKRPNECRPGGGGRMSVQNNDVQVDFTVRLPSGLDFVGRTVNGDVDATALAGRLDLKTVNGSIDFSTSGFGQASTVNGSIRAALGSSGWSEPLEFRTVNGSITLSLPPETSADVRAQTVNGNLTTDFPMTVVGRASARRLQGSIGKGGPELHLSTVNGGIRLRRSG